MTTPVLLHINGEWTPGSSGEFLDVVNPATGENVLKVARATIADLDRAAEAAVVGFDVWRRTSAIERSQIMRKAAGILRERVDGIAVQLTLENGKPLGQARLEILSAVDMIEWFAEEGRRAYGRVIPGRSMGCMQLSLR